MYDYDHYYIYILPVLGIERCHDSMSPETYIYNYSYYTCTTQVCLL